MGVNLLAHRVLDPPKPSLWSPLDRVGGRGDLLLTWEDGGFREASWDDWRAKAVGFAAGLRTLGVRPSDRVAFLLTNSLDACAAVLGAWLAGACVVSLPLPARGMEVARYLVQLRAIAAQAEPVLIVADPAVEKVLSDADLGPRIATFRAVPGGPASEPDLPAAEDAVFVQYSSGSTTEPKGCVLSAGAIAYQLAALADALEIDPEVDTGVVWLPLSHDMGLFGCALLTYWTGHRLVLGTPQRFLSQPWTWFEDCAAFGATVSAAPGFGLDFATRVARRRQPPPVPMRRLVLGGERIEPASVDRAVEVLGDDRLARSAVVPAYGLAEAVLAVTVTPLGEGPTVVELACDPLERGELVVGEAADGSAARRTAVVSVGRALPGCAVRVEPDGGIGEVVVESPCLGSGYLGGQPWPVRDGGLMTGDLGFVENGRLFITGRQDDLVCLGGRNVYTRDIELSLADVPGVRPGNCAVVAVADGASTDFVALVEARGRTDYAAMARELSVEARRAAGVAIDRCVFLPRGRLPKTPSGKIQRFRCRQIAAGEGEGLEDAVRVTL